MYRLRLKYEPLDLLAAALVIWICAGTTLPAQQYGNAALGNDTLGNSANGNTSQSSPPQFHARDAAIPAAQQPEKQNESEDFQKLLRSGERNAVADQRTRNNSSPSRAVAPAVYQPLDTQGTNGQSGSAAPRGNLPATATAPLQIEQSPAPRLLPPERQPLPLAAPGKDDKPKSVGGWGNLLTMLLSLGIVLALFVVCVKLLLRGYPNTGKPLSRDVVEVLGRASLPGRQTLQVIRFGNKILLVALSPGGCDTLTEITDPVEIDRLAGLCHQQQAASATATFGQIFSQLTSRRPKELPAAEVEDDTEEPANDPRGIESPAVQAARQRLNAAGRLLS